LGKCLLAYQDPLLRERIITSLDYTRATPNSISTPEQLRKDLAAIHLKGYAFDNGESSLEVRCIAVPVFDLDRHLIGAVSVSGTSGKFSGDKLPLIVDKVKACAVQITSELMF
ncbi:MAG: IclR family transcriptional regulator, partial [Succinivibrio sp.]